MQLDSDSENTGLDIEEVGNAVLQHFKDNYEEYQHYHPTECPEGIKRELMTRQIQRYFQTGNYRRNIVDLVVPLTCKVLNINMRVYQEDSNNKVSVLEQNHHPNNRTIELVFERKLNPTTGKFTGHYDGIISMKAFKKLQEDDTQDNPEAGESDSSTVNYISEDNRSDDKIDDNRSDEKVDGNKSDEKVDDTDSDVEILGVYTPAVPKPIVIEDDAADVLPSSFQLEHLDSSDEDFLPDLTEEGLARLQIKAEESGSSDSSDSSEESSFDEDDDSTHHLHRKAFDFFRLSNIKPEKVSRVPFDVDGDHIYDIKAKASTWNRKAKDGRNFKMKVTSRAEVSKREYYLKVGNCYGSYKCANKDCDFLKSNQDRGLDEPNTNSFKKDKTSGKRLCHTCGSVATHVRCSARKYTQFRLSKDGGRRLRVFHIGKHTCKVKTNHAELKEKWQKIAEENPDKTPKQVSMDLLGEAVAAGNDQEIDQLLDDFCHLDKLRRVKWEMKVKNDPYLGQSDWNIVADWKEKCDRRDKYLVAEINPGNHNNRPPFAVHSSEFAVETMINMNCEGRGNSPMKSEPVHFDAMHSRTEGFKTLTLWTYHPASRHVLLLAIMEVKREDKKSLVAFWEAINKLLQEHTGIANYIFNPVAFMCDEGSANKPSVIDVFGKAGGDKVVTCHYHYRNCAEARLHQIKEEYREEFLDTVENICQAETKHRYEELWQRLTTICSESSKEAQGWVDWWHARRKHIVPYLRATSKYRSNYAEIGHASLKNGQERKQIPLRTACRRNALEMMIRSRKIQNFLENKAGSDGKGPNQQQRLNQHMIRERRKNRQMADLLEVDEDALILAELADETEDETFIPNKSASHKAPKNPKGIQGQVKKFHTKKPTNRGRRGKAVTFKDPEVSEVSAPTSGSDEEGPPKKIQRKAARPGNKKITSGEVSEVDTEVEESAPQKVQGKKTGRQRKMKTSVQVSDLDTDVEESVPQKVQRKRTGRPKVPVAVSDLDGDADEEEESNGQEGKQRQSGRVRKLKRLSGFHYSPEEKRKRARKDATAEARKIAEEEKNDDKRTGPDPAHRRKLIALRAQLRKRIPRTDPQPAPLEEMEPNPAVLVRRNQGSRITKCQGCDEGITDRQTKAPKNLVFRRLGYRAFPLENHWVFKRKAENIYFHCSLDCLETYSEGFKAENVECPATLWRSLTKDQKRFLAREKLLPHFIKQAEEADTDTDSQ